MDQSNLKTTLTELQSAEDFLDHFGVDYDARVVQVNRLHILQRFHDYLTEASVPSDGGESWHAACAELLTRAYRDFVGSDAQSEKVFKVFRRQEPQTAFVPLTSIGTARSR